MTVIKLTLFVRCIREKGIPVVIPKIGASYDSGILDPDNATDAPEGESNFIYDRYMMNINVG